MSTQATNTTPNYHLSQWAEDDRILRQDFNADLATIDTTLAATEEKIALVRLYDGTLAANSSAVVIDLSSVDMSRITKLEMHIANLNHTMASTDLRLRINGQSGEEDYAWGSLDIYFQSYLDVISISQSREHFVISQLFSTGTRLLHTVRMYGSVDLSESCMPTLKWDSSNGLWLGGTLADVETLTLFPSSGSLLAGMHVTLYGYRI